MWLWFIKISQFCQQLTKEQNGV
ncbi:hypothetical protein L345_01804 [Ophiophagus hannah]|uniref:Uncharacterized protein n=1 Tax=Ophiophagus hannah TaxID=8665 RepID=V8PEP0_OPHHA|nr:hypothetical protein L345_01804 [Ophiophagus hannah]